MKQKIDVLFRPVHCRRHAVNMGLFHALRRRLSAATAGVHSLLLDQIPSKLSNYRPVPFAVAASKPRNLWRQQKAKPLNLTELPLLSIAVFAATTLFDHFTQNLQLNKPLNYLGAEYWQILS